MERYDTSVLILILFPFGRLQEKYNEAHVRDTVQRIQVVRSRP